MKTNFQRQSIALTSTPVIVNIVSRAHAGKKYEGSSDEKPTRMSPTKYNANHRRNQDLWFGVLLPSGTGVDRGAMGAPAPHGGEKN